MRRALRRALVLAGVVAAVLSVPATAIAHPLGNFTVNRYAAIELTPDEVRIDYVLERGGMRGVKGAVTGEASSTRTPGGLWPSDHGGLWMTLRLPGR